mmetsp:Transcript_32192/g.49909  ORF Transcript_32192/g.49909 Transcript_32192/m.49909 type:complete len:369 (+) Transcript_32192:161-1267(+)
MIRQVMMSTVVALLVSFSFCDASQRALLPAQVFPRNNSPDFRVALRRSAWACRVALEDLRGGSTADEDSDEYDEYDESTDEEEYKVDVEIEEASDEEGNDEYDEEDAYDNNPSRKGDFDEPYVMSPATQLCATFGCIMLSQRIDLFAPAIVRIIRVAFVVQILIQQLFIVYVRVVAKKTNDRTAVTTQNPISGVLQSQLQNSEAGGMMKTLASSFLSSETTAMEYDMKEAKNMQGGVLFNMAFIWFLHFRMEQVQPVLIQVVTGFLQLVYNPLFQVYILGRNLERPFKTAASMAQKTRVAQHSTKAGVKKDDDAENGTDQGADEESSQELEDGEETVGEDDEAGYVNEDSSDEHDTDENTNTRDEKEI